MSNGSSNSNNARQKTLKDLVHYTSTTIIGQGFTMLRTVLLPVLFSPAQLGIWNIMFVILNYSGNAHLGILHGMNKEIPLLRGSGKDEEVKDMKDSIFWLIILIGLILLIGLFFTSFFVSDSYVIPLRIVSVTAFLQLLFFYFFSVLRADSQFILISKGVLFFSILSSLLVGLLAFYSPNHLIGALLGIGIAYLFIVAYWVTKVQFRVPFRFKKKAIQRSFFIGIPLIIIGLLDSLIISIDRWVILWNLDQTKLGYYALGLMVSGVLGIIPSSFASVLYSRMLERFAVNKNSKDIDSLFFVPMRAIWGLMLFLICISIIILPLLIRLLIPKYLDSIPIIEIFALGTFFISTSLIPGSYLITNNKHRWLILIQVLTGIFIFIVDTILIYAGYGLIGIALGTVSGYAIYGIAYSVCAMLITIENRSTVLLLMAKQLFPFILMVISFIVISPLFSFGIDPGMQIFSAFLKLIILSCILFASLWLVNRDGEVMAFARPEIKAFLAKFIRSKQN